MNGIGKRDDVRPIVIDPHREEDWPASIPPGTRRYLTALSGNGPERLAANARGVRGEILRVGDQVMPVLVSDGRPGKASILSPLGHHVHYPVEEIGRRSRFPGRRGLGALVAPLTYTFRAGRLDKVVLINHWLLSGAPEPPVPASAWPRILAYLAERHPHHALVVQDIKPALEPKATYALEAAGAFGVPTRRVNIIDPSRPLDGGRFRKTRYKRTQGQRMVEEAEADRISDTAARKQCECLARLYRNSNVARHSTLNPDYHAEFFKVALGCETFLLHAWRAPGVEDNDIAAFNLQRRDAKTIHWSTFGAEQDPDGSASYYERITAIDLKIALDQGLRLDWGAGADEFKRLRGAVAHDQVEMVYTDHLPSYRRATWRLLARLRHVRHRQIMKSLEAGKT